MSNDEIVTGFDDVKDDSLKVHLHKVERLENGLLLCLNGNLDSDNRLDFEKRVIPAIDAGCIRLIFDIRGLNYCGDAGIGAFIEILKRVKPRGGDIALFGIQPGVIEVFRLLGVSQFFTIKDTLDEAVAVFTGMPTTAGGENDVSAPRFPDAACENLEIRMRGLEKIPHGLLVTPKGYVDTFNRRCFVSHIERAIAAGYHRLVFDLRDVEWAGDAIITTMIGFIKAVKPLGGGIVLCNIQPAIMEVITLLGFSQFFTIKKTLEQALEVFSCKPENAPSSNDAIIPGFDDEKDDSLRIQLRRIDGLEHGLLLTLDGYVDSYNRQSFERRVILAIDAGYFRLAFDVRGLKYSGDMGFGVFTAFLKRVKPRGGDIAFFGIPSRVFEVFQLLGFSQFFNIRETFDEAIAFFASAGEPPAFPIVLKCPICSRRVRAAKPGRFRCRTCKTILSVDPAGQVILG
jgi:anti-sigma B factor antagonist